MFVEPVNVSFEIKNVQESVAAFSPVEAAKARLVEFLRQTHPEIDPSQIVFEFAEPVTWNNGSLGCPEEGHFYTQALVPGYRIGFRVGNDLYTLHTNGSGSSVVSPDFRSHY